MADKVLPLLTEIRVGVRLNSKMDYRHSVATTKSVFLQTVTYVENVAFAMGLHTGESGADMALALM